MANLPVLTKTEWYAMMATVLSDVSIDPTDRWSSIQAPGNQDGTHLSEIPDNHPAKGGPVTPEGEVDDEIPAGGGFVVKIGKPDYTKNTVLHEIPSDGPASKDSPADKPNLEPGGKFSPKVGRPMPTGTPSGSFAELHDLQYDGTAWVTKGPVSPGGSIVWNAFPTGTSDGTGPDGSPRKSDMLNRTPGANGYAADEDLDHDVPDNLSLPDGTFFTLNVDDLRNNIDKIKNADQTNPRSATHPWFMDVKQHLMNRAKDLSATNLIPSDWNLSMGMLAERELARDVNAATRADYVKKGWALANASYPIGNASDLKNAITLAQSGHGDVTAAKALIRRRAKDLGVKLPAGF